MYIYKTTNLLNNKIYVGKCSKKIEDSLNYFGSGTLLKRSVQKYGIENFKKEILFETNELIELNEKEKYYIKILNSYDIKIGYNIGVGGSGGDNFTNNPNKEKIKEKLSKQNLGRKRSEEINKKIVETFKKRYIDGELKSRKMENNSFYGKHHTEETKNKISEKNRGKKMSEDSIIKRTETLKRKYANGEIIRIVSQETRDKVSKIHTGMKHSDEAREKISLSTQGSKNPSAKEWVFINEKQEEFLIKGEFRKFCLENNLSYKAMRMIAYEIRKNKFYNGWTVKKYEKNENKEI